MRRSILGKMGFSTAIVLMLAFGAREAFSSPTAQTSRVSCENDEQCQSFCEIKYNTPNVYGWCDGAPFGHCHCEL